VRLKKARQLIKALSDDTRLRIVNLLNKKSLSVSELCQTLGKGQPNISKHLMRLRLTELVKDKRDGNTVYYQLNKPLNAPHKHILNAITRGFKTVDIFKKDIEKIKKIKR